MIATNGSMQADAFLFQQLVEPGDLVVVEAPDLRPHAAGAAQPRRGHPGHPARGRRHRRGRAGARRSRPARVRRLAHIIPNFQNPAGCTLSLEKRRRLLELAAEYGFTIFEDDPYVELRFEGEDQPTMLSLDEGGTRRLRVVVLEDGLPRHPRRLPGRLGGHDRRRSASWPRAPTSRRAWSRRRSWPSSAHSGAIDGSIETVKAALRERRDATAAALGHALPRRPLRLARGRLLPVGGPARGHRRGGPRDRRRGARRGVREGHRLPARGRRELVPHRLLGRPAGPDRGGHRPPGRGSRRASRAAKRSVRSASGRDAARARSAPRHLRTVLRRARRLPPQRRDLPRALGRRGGAGAPDRGGRGHGGAHERLRLLAVRRRDGASPRS